MPIFKLPVRHYRCYPLPGQEYDERNFGHVYRAQELDPAATALVTVDLWNMNYGPEPLVPELGREAEIGFIGLGERACAEAKRVMDENIAPALQAARQGGLTVIHCNSERVLRRYPECLVEAAPTVGRGLVPRRPLSAITRRGAVRARALQKREQSPSWPPPEIRQAVLDDYVKMTWGEGAEERWEAMRAVADFPGPLRPVPGDLCVYQQAAFDQIMRERRITTLIYVGFLLAHCLMDKPGGLRSTAAVWNCPGYRTILLRDCTIAQESAESIDGFETTKAFIFWLEASSIPTATVADLQRALSR
jgi:nicotinamidase-related amidase